MRKEYLEQEIQKHNYLFWHVNDPEISDDAYDKLIEELRNIDPEHPLVTAIHTPFVNSNNKIQHQTPMLSLDKAYNSEELLKWCYKVARDYNETFIVQPKLDGWSVKYNQKYLITRGDGEFGDDISDKIPLITLKTKHYEGPLKDYNKNVIGEVLLSKSKFKNLNTTYKTPRTALSGILTRDDLLFDFECLDLLTYDYITTETYNNCLFEFQYREFDRIIWDNILEYVKHLDYATDGLVIKLKDFNYSYSLGNTSHHPRGQLCLKPKNPSALSTITGFNIFVGKDNAITPVIRINPVEILGHMITKASVHNYSELRRLDIHIGDQVLIERCGEIIPQIKKCFPGEKREEIIINKCPVCESSVKVEGKFLYCTNQNCLGSLAKRLTDSCKRIGLQSIGPAITQRLIDIGLEEFWEIFEMTKEDMSQISGFQQKSINNMFNEISRIKTSSVEDWKILASLNIPYIGKSLSKKLLQKHTIYNLMEMNIEQLEKIDDIGPERASLLYYGLIENSDLEYFLNNFNIISTKSNNTNNQFKVCFTGKMPQKRSYYEQIAEQNNMLPTSTVTKDLDLLVAADLNDNRGKLQKARTLNLKIIDLNDFLNQYTS